MNWYTIVRLVLVILKILDLLPKEEKVIAEKEAFEAVAKVVTEQNTT